MWANLHLSCVLTVKDIEFFLVESALALGNDREAEQHVMVSKMILTILRRAHFATYSCDELWSFKKNLLRFYSATSYKLRNSCEGTVVWLDANDNCLQVQSLKVWRAIPALPTLRNTRRKISAGLDEIFLQMS